MLNKEIFLNHIIIAFAMAVMFLLGTATTASALDETDSDIASGTYDNVPWRITADYELLIGEEGKEYTYSYNEFMPRVESSWPWSKYPTCNRIQEVTILTTRQ